MAFNPQMISRIVVLGRTRCGKTDLTRLLMRSYPRIIIIDRHHDFRPDGQTHFFSEFQPFAEFLLKAQFHSKFKVVFQISPHDMDFQATTEEIFALIYDMGNVLLSIDECQYYSGSHYLQQLVLSGARNDIAVMTTTQRPANLSKDFISSGTDFYVGMLFETNDLKYLKGMIPEEDLPKVAAMQKYKFLHWQPGEQSEIVGNR